MVKRHRPMEQRDKEILILSESGVRRKVIAKTYGISDSTVKNILAKERKNEQRTQIQRAHPG